jgi:hypothetical protein
MDQPSSAAVVSIEFALGAPAQRWLMSVAQRAQANLAPSEKLGWQNPSTPISPDLRLSLLFLLKQSTFRPNQLLFR